MATVTIESIEQFKDLLRPMAGDFELIPQEELNRGAGFSFMGREWIRHKSWCDRNGKSCNPLSAIVHRQNGSVSTDAPTEVLWANDDVFFFVPSAIFDSATSRSGTAADQRVIADLRDWMRRTLL